MVETEVLQTFELLVAGGGREHGRASLLGELDRGHADASRPGVNQSGVPRLEMTCGEQALLGRPERDWDTRRGSSVQPGGNRPRGHCGNRALGGVRPRRVEGYQPVADSAVRDPCADLDDGARGEIPDDVRDRARRRPRAVQQVPALDADRLDVDQHAAVRALGIRHVLVARASRADELGMVVLAAFEGALILSRTYRDLAPLDSVRRETRERMEAELAREGGS